MPKLETYEVYESCLDGEWYYCGKCGHKLAKQVQGCVCVFSSHEARPQLEVKCKHKSNGKHCNAINEILL